MLTCFYQEQDQVIENADAVRRAVENTVRWLRERGYTNVILEIANEHPHAGFDHELIRAPDGVSGLIRLAREAAPGLLVSASGLGNGRLDHTVQSAASFILLHFNDTPVGAIQARVAAARKISKAIVANEDQKTGAEGARALEAAVNAFASWGYMNKEKNQYYPFTFEGAGDDPVLYGKMKELTAPRR